MRQVRKDNYTFLEKQSYPIITYSYSVSRLMSFHFFEIGNIL